MEEILVPICICCILPVAIVAIVFYSISRANKLRADVAIKAIESGRSDINLDSLFESRKKEKKGPAKYLSAGLNLAGVGVALLIAYWWCDLKGSFMLIAGLICLILGIANSVLYFVFRKKQSDEGPEADSDDAQ